jgi:two-component system phosphate regulon sensor histidine kinase PhoR
MRISWSDVLKSRIFLGYSFGIAAAFGVFGILSYWAPEGSFLPWVSGGMLFLFALALGFRLTFPVLSLLAWKPASEKREEIKTHQPSGWPLELGDIAESDEGYFEAEWGDLGSQIRMLQGDAESLRVELIQERLRLHALLDSIREGVVVIDPQGLVILQNAQFRKWFYRGVRKEEPNSGLKVGLAEIFRDSRVQEAFEKAALGLVGVGSEEVLQVDIDLHVGSEPRPRSFRLRIAPIQKKISIEQESGTRVPVVGIFLDVTELKRAERMRIDFVANVSHELRTPLTSIRGFSEALLEDLKAGRMDSLERSSEKILSNADRLGVLVQDLLDLSQLESGRERELNRERLDLAVLTRRVVNSLEGVRVQRNFKVELEVEDGSKLYADLARVEQVLENLLGNAYRYATSGTTVSVRWGLEEDQCILQVKDQGPGISPEHLSRLFERFYRVDPDRSRNSGGTGLGLAIVKHIVQAHGGHVSVESSLGKGTTFTCCFPGVAQQES